MSLLERLPFPNPPATAGRLPWLTGAALIGGVALVALGSLIHLRQQETEHWQRRVDRIAQVTSRTAAEVYAAPAAMLNRIAENLQSDIRDSAELAARLREQSPAALLLRDSTPALPGVDALFIVGTDGTLLAAEGGAASRDPVVRKAVTAAYVRERARDGIQIDAPLRQRDGKRVYLLSRTLKGPQAQPLGRVSMVMPLAPLTNQLGKSVADDGLDILLYRNDHIPLAAWPDAGAAIPASWERQQGGVMATRPVEGYAAMVRVTASDAVVLRRWRRAAQAVGFTALGAALALLVAMTLLYRARRRQCSEAEMAAGLRRDAEQAATEKTRFLSRMRHDVRTPMNGVLGMTELLLQSNLTREQRQYAATAHESGKSLLKIMDDLIEHSRRDGAAPEIRGGALTSAMPPAAAASPGPAAAPGPSLRPRVLVAEDSEVNRQLIQILLARMGCDARFAENGQEALDALAQDGADLVLMDCMMPVMDGYEAVRRLREREGRTGARRLPVIALTGNSTGEDKSQCLAAGMDDYLAKPFTGAAFTALVGRWLGRAPQSPQSPP